ncbi:MAG: D-alanyl-D-alanine carboxypeptidase [Beijerinckiaceae bacterium]|nr:MAG: D-alanyl-D-alanine carboxypeptidase [Beijerinckiaceae bacterium]
MSRPKSRSSENDCGPMQTNPMNSRSPLRTAALTLALGLTASAGLSRIASANPAIVVDAATGNVVYAEQATHPWFPASLTKLMTFYVALEAVRDHRINLDTPIVMSARAARAVPSKMGFKPGTEVTLDNALKMMVVKSANDLAIAVAEAVDGSVEAFADDMNATAARLGMRQSHFVNPNGLPNPDHYSSAHDLAILARAIHVDFPKEAGWFGLGALSLGEEIIRNHNDLLGRYPGVDGMKTGFTCAAGFNLIATAKRDGHRYIAVVMGAPNTRSRMIRTAVLLDRAFDGIDHPETTLKALDVVGSGTPPDMHSEVCRRRGKALVAYRAQTARLEAPLLATKTSAGAASPFLNAGAGTELAPVAPTIASVHRQVFEPTPVFVGPAAGYQGPIAEARPANSPVGTPFPPGTKTAAEEPKPDTVATSEPAKTHHHRRHRHAAHRKAVHHHARRKTAHRGKEKAIIVENKAASHAGKAEHEKRKVAVHAEKHKVAGKHHTVARHHAAKKKHAVKHAKKAKAKHVAGRPMQLEGGKIQSTRSPAHEHQ